MHTELRSDEGGFTLMEVLIAGSIGVIVAFTVAKSAISATQAQKASELDANYAVMMTRLETAIEDPGLCPDIWNSTTSTPVAFNPGTPPSVGRLQDGQPNFIAATVAGGGPSVGLRVDTMAFEDPVMISDNTYVWSFKIQVTKIPPAGVTFLGNPTSIRRIRIEVTSNGAAGSPAYRAIACGPPISAAAEQHAPNLRFTSTSTAALCTATDANKDAACATEFSNTYTAGTVADLIAYRMVPRGSGGIPATSQAFVVGGSPLAFTNANDGTRPSRTLVEVTTPAQCVVACMRNTAPLRFTRNSYAANVAGKDGICQGEVGWEYRAAGPNDLARYGVRAADGEVAGGQIPTYTNVIFDGNFDCALGWSSAAPAGPALDCARATVGQLGCVLK